MLCASARCLMLGLLLSTTKAQLCIQRTKSSGSSIQMMRITSVSCTGHGNEGTINITVSYSHVLPSYSQVEYQCYDSGSYFPENNTVLRNWNSVAINSPLTASLNATSLTVCVAVGCYEVEGRDSNAALTNSMSCNFTEGTTTTITITTITTITTTPTTVTATTANTSIITLPMIIPTPSSLTTNSPLISVTISPPSGGTFTLDYTTIVAVATVTSVLVSVFLSTMIILFIAKRIYNKMPSNKNWDIHNEVPVSAIYATYDQDPEVQSVRTVYCSLSTSDQLHSNEYEIDNNPDTARISRTLQISITSSNAQRQDNLSDSGMDMNPALSHLPQTTHVQLTDTDSGFSMSGKPDQTGSSTVTTVHPEYLEMSLFVRN